MSHNGFEDYFQNNEMDLLEVYLDEKNFKPLLDWMGEGSKLQEVEEDFLNDTKSLYYAEFMRWAEETWRNREPMDGGDR